MPAVTALESWLRLHQALIQGGLAESGLNRHWQEMCDAHTRLGRDGKTSSWTNRWDEPLAPAQRWWRFWSTCHGWGTCSFVSADRVHAKGVNEDNTNGSDLLACKLKREGSSLKNLEIGQDKQVAPIGDAADSILTWPHACTELDYRSLALCSEETIGLTNWIFTSFSQWVLTVVVYDNNLVER
jgi:hypothetical protein